MDIFPCLASCVAILLYSKRIGGNTLVAGIINIFFSAKSSKRGIKFCTLDCKSFFLLYSTHLANGFNSVQCQLMTT